MIFIGTTDMFGSVHIAALIATIVLVVVGFIFAKKKLNIDQITNILFIVGIISETIKVFAYILMNEAKLGGYLPKTDLPFQLCSIQIIFILILKITKNKDLKRFLYSFMAPSCLLGGIFAVLIPTSSSRSTWPITIQYFGYHAAIMIFALYLLTNLEEKFTIKDYLNSLKFLAGVAFFAFYINSMVYDPVQAEAGISQINFMYVVNPPQEGLPFLNKDHGWLVYIVHYGILAVTLISLVYIVPIIKFFKGLIENKKTKKHKAEEIQTSEKIVIEEQE